MNLLRETVISSEQFQKECQGTYFKLYYIFDVLNLLCLQGQLDRVPLMLNLDRQGKRVLASANFLKTPRQRKPFCFIEIRLIPCAALSTGCFLGVMLHEMNISGIFSMRGRRNMIKSFTIVCQGLDTTTNR